MPRNDEPTSKAQGQPDELVGDQDPKIFVLKRELSEVHLLLDNLSANPDRSLTTEPDKDEKLDDNWIEQVCRLNWPPSGTPADQAKHAALLIRAKDFLNRQAKPASGGTIAFTLLVAQGNPDGGEDARTDKAASRNSLARQAYPGMVHRARTFRRVMIGISAFLCLLLGITCLISWYVAFGAATLNQRTSAQLDVASAEKRVNEAEAGTSQADPTPKQQTTATTAQQSQPTPATKGPLTPYVLKFCDRSSLLPPLTLNGHSVPQYYSVADIQACDALHNAQSNAASIDKILIGWVNLVNWRRLKWPTNGDADVAASVLATSILNILGGGVLPVFYGILGAAAAVVRSVSGKIKASLLSPRDLHLSLQQLALGGVTGSCIGLFIAQPSTAGQGAPGLIGTVALSSSALSFVAGFGVEQVFSAMEGLIRRIFLVGAPAEAPKP